MPTPPPPPRRYTAQEYIALKRANALPPRPPAAAPPPPPPAAAPPPPPPGSGTASSSRLPPLPPAPTSPASHSSHPRPGSTRRSSSIFSPHSQSEDDVLEALRDDRSEDEAGNQAERRIHFNRLKAQLLHLFATLSGHRGFEGVFLIAGPVLGEDQGLVALHETRGARNFFLQRCFVAEDVVKKDFQAHISDLRSRGLARRPVATPPRLTPTRKERSALEDAISPSHRLRVLLTQLLERSGGSFPTGNSFPWLKLLDLLPRYGIQVLNWPEDVPYPGQESNVRHFKGLSSLTHVQIDVMLHQIHHAKYPLNFHRYEGDRDDLKFGKVPIILGAPPPACSEFTFARRIYRAGSGIRCTRDGAHRRMSYSSASEDEEDEDDVKVEESAEESAGGSTIQVDNVRGKGKGKGKGKADAPTWETLAVSEDEDDETSGSARLPRWRRRRITTNYVKRPRWPARRIATPTSSPSTPSPPAFSPPFLPHGPLGVRVEAPPVRELSGDGNPHPSPSQSGKRKASKSDDRTVSREAAKRIRTGRGPPGVREPAKDVRSDGPGVGDVAKSPPKARPAYKNALIVEPPAALAQTASSGLSAPVPVGPSVGGQLFGQTPAAPTQIASSGSSAPGPAGPSVGTSGPSSGHLFGQTPAGPRGAPPVPTQQQQQRPMWEQEPSDEYLRYMFRQQRQQQQSAHHQPAYGAPPFNLPFPPPPFQQHISAHPYYSQYSLPTPHAHPQYLPPPPHHALFLPPPPPHHALPMPPLPPHQAHFIPQPPLPPDAHGMSPPYDARDGSTGTPDAGGGAPRDT